MTETSTEEKKNTAWWPWVLPFALFMILTTFEPKFGDSVEKDTADTASQFEASPSSDESDTAIAASAYFLQYSIKIFVIGIFLIIFCRIYLKHCPFRVSRLGLATGLLGGVIWIGLCHLQIERTLASWIGLPDSWFAQRSGINPANHYAYFFPLAAFYAVRFAGLVMVVPIIEEIFLRGFFIRYLEDTEFWKVKFNRLGWFPLLVAPLYGVLSHPMSEAIAAASWFGLITWLMVKSNNLWDCVLAHSITNLMLGLYVTIFGIWHLW